MKWSSDKVAEAARDPGWYREEADRLRLMAHDVDHALLHESYLQLARAYDQLATALEQARPSKRR